MIRATAWRLRWVGFVLGALLVAWIAVPGVAQALRQTCSAVVLAQSVEVGQSLEPGDVTQASVACNLVPESAIDLVEVAIGQRVTAKLPGGMVLVPELLAEKGVVDGAPDGLVVAPVRLSDGAVAGLLQVGDRIDVLGAAGVVGVGEVVPAQRLASKATVLSLPQIGDRFEEPGLVLIAVTPGEAELLSGAASWAVISAVLVR